MAVKNKDSELSLMPTGLASRLVHNTEAMRYYTELTEQKKQQLISYVTGGTSGKETKARMAEAIDMLSRHETEFN